MCDNITVRSHELSRLLAYCDFCSLSNSPQEFRRLSFTDSHPETQHAILQATFRLQSSSLSCVWDWFTGEVSFPSVLPSVTSSSWPQGPANPFLAPLQAQFHLLAISGPLWAHWRPPQL